ncbi:hypothetical protein LINPERHAP2_LOCUS29176 [Linum perenne]
MLALSSSSQNSRLVPGKSRFTIFTAKQIVQRIILPISVTRLTSVVIFLIIQMFPFSTG